MMKSAKELKADYIVFIENIRLAEVCVPTTTARVVCLAAHIGVINEKKINAASPTRIQIYCYQ